MGIKAPEKLLDGLYILESGFVSPITEANGCMPTCSEGRKILYTWDKMFKDLSGHCGIV